MNPEPRPVIDRELIEGTLSDLKFVLAGIQQRKESLRAELAKLDEQLAEIDGRRAKLEAILERLNRAI